MEELYLKKFRMEFGTKEACYRALLKARAQGQKKCFSQACLRKIDDYVLLNDRPAFFCKGCFQQFSPMVCSFLDHNKKDIKDVFEIIYRFLSTPAGISALQIRKDYNLSERSAFYLLQDIRKQMGHCLNFYFENNEVECDESYFLTGNKGMDRHFSWKKGRGSDHCDAVFAIMERGGGRVRMFVIDDCSRDTLEPLILKHISRSCIICTDKWDAYDNLGKLGYIHRTVDHAGSGPGKYVNGIASTNNNEGIWGFTKKTIHGIYGSTSPEHLQEYLDEKCFRHTYGKLPDSGLSIFFHSLPALQNWYESENLFSNLAANDR